LRGRAFRALGKSLLILTGVGYGMVKALDLLAAESGAGLQDAVPSKSKDAVPSKSKDAVPASLKDSVPASPSPAVSQGNTSDTTLHRLEAMEERLIRMEKDLGILVSPERTHGRTSEDFVTRAEQNAAMEQLASRLEAEIERRFEVQNRSVQSLRTMIARTDELLEQVIERIESTSVSA